MKFWISLGLGTLAFGVILYYFLQVTIISVPIILALLIALLVEPFVVHYEKKGMTRSRVVTYMALGTVAVLGLIVGFGGPFIKDQFLAYAVDAVPRVQTRLSENMASLQHMLREELPIHIEVNFEEKMAEMSAQFQHEILPHIPLVLAESVVGMLIVLVAAYFFIIDGRDMRKKVVEMVPNRYFEMALMIIYRAGEQVANYVRGVGKESTAVAIVDFIALIAFGIDVGPAIFLSVLAGALNVIPYVGSAISIGIAAIVGLSAPESKAWQAPVALLVGRLVDDALLAPLLLGHAVNIHPILVVVLCVIGGKILGIMGLVLVVPMFAVMRVVLQELYIGIRSYNKYIP